MMEKSQQQLEAGAVPLRPRRRWLTPYLAALVFASALLHLCLPDGAKDAILRRSNGCHSRNGAAKHHKIGKLTATKCWDTEIKPPYKCFYLHAPLDYLNHTDARTARLAVVTYPAGGGKTPADEVMGTLLLNPGGPGGSGIDFLTSTGARFNYTSTGAAIDKVMKGRYNLLSWDPRAVGYTTPLANCSRWEYQGSDCGGGLPRSSSAATTCNLQTERLTAQLCKEKLSDVLRFVSTSSTARDMRLLYKAAGDSILHYWGFSYGTVLGSTFADMFPDELGRMVLDGTVDVPDYMAGNWSNNLVNTDGTYERGLLGECERAGDRCRLNEAVKGKGLKEALDEKYRQLIAEPMISTHTNTTFLTYSAFKGQIFSALYSTYSWPNITRGMAEAMNGNATYFIKQFIDHGREKEAGPEAFNAIAGGDALIRREDKWTLDDYEETIVQLEKESKFAGEVWATDKTAVQTWPIIAKERHFGNFTSLTRNPILYVGNDYDPVTPLRYAQKMATLFPNASVMRVKMYGHCSTAQPSKCARKTISKYFVDGEIPPRVMGRDGYLQPGKVCDVDRQPWDKIKVQSSHEEDDGMDGVIHDALRGAWRRPMS